MLTYPEFAPHINATFLAPDMVVISGSGWKTRLTSNYWGVLYQLINGTTSLDDIVDQALVERPDWDATDLYTFLFQLEKRGFVVEAQHHYTALDVLAIAASQKRSASNSSQLPPLRLHTVGQASGEVLSAALALSGIVITDSDSNSDTAALDVYATDDYLRPELADINRRHIASSTPWVLLQTNGFEPMLGPWFTPGSGACWECLASRQRMNRDLTEFLGSQVPEGYPFPERVHMPGSELFIAGTLADQLALAQTNQPTAIHGSVLSWNALRSDSMHHSVVQRPQCAVCGTNTQVHSPESLAFASSPRKQTSDAGYRSMTSEQVFEKYKHHISPISGVVTGLERITDPTDPVQHVYVSGQNFATSYRNIHHLKSGLRSSSCGKGTTDIQAKVSGLCEAIERYSGVFRGDEHRITTSLRDLADRGIHQNDILLLSERQYQERSEWNARDHKFSLVCEPFDVDAQYEWSPVWSVTEERTKWLPTGHLYYSYPPVSNKITFLPCSNGASTGASIEEATLQGFLELVERDAFAIWWYPRTRQPRVDLSSYDNPYVRAMERRSTELGRELWVIDITSDLGIPVFVAFSRDLKGQPENITFAPGAHFDPEIALLRALTELNQMLPGIAPGPNGQGYAFDDPHSADWWKNATVENQPYIYPDDSLPMSKREHYSVPQTSDLLEDIAIARSLVESRGMEFLVHNQTRPDIGMPVVKVIVPGLRHFWTRYASGRLFDVPVNLGRIQSPISEEDLNPIALFI